MKITIDTDNANMPGMFTDYSEMGTLKNIIKQFRPTEIAVECHAFTPSISWIRFSHTPRSGIPKIPATPPSQ